MPAEEEAPGEAGPAMRTTGVADNAMASAPANATTLAALRLLPR